MKSMVKAPGVRLSRLLEVHQGSGVPLDLKERILSFAFEDHEEKADLMRLTLENSDLSLFDRVDLLPGTLLEVRWGYANSMTPPRRMIIEKLKGFTVLTLEARALSMLLDRAQKTRNFVNKTYSEIVTDIAQAYGYQGPFLKIETTQERLEVVNQSSETDAAFIKRLAAKVGYVFFIDGGRFHFHGRRKLSVPRHSFTWQGGEGHEDLLSLSMQSDISRQVGRAEVVGRDPVSKETIRHKGSNSSSGQQVLGEVIEVVDPETGETSLQQRTAATRVQRSASQGQTQVTSEATRNYRNNTSERTRLSMKVIGDPTLQAKSIVSVQGISRRLSGNYYVKSIRHDIGGQGYTCQLQLTRESLGRLPGVEEQQAQGEQNRHKGAVQDNSEVIEMVNPESGETYLRYR